jgi:hypothetical protein
MEMTLGQLNNLIEDARNLHSTCTGENDEDVIWNTSILIKRYNTKLHLDRVIIYTNNDPVELVFTDLK